MLTTSDIDSYIVKWDFSKGAVQVEKYGEHYVIEITNHTYKIIEVLDSGKLKTRRISVGSKIKGKRDQFGNQLYKPYNNKDLALVAAKNYIDNFIQRWETKIKQ